MKEAAKAIENAIAFEAKKDGLQQKQDGSWTLRLTIAGQDMHQQITQAAMGTRYQVVVVEVGDNEEAVDHKMEERSRWADLGATKQAAMRCRDPVFWAWLEEERGYEANSNDDAAAYVRNYCGVASRSELAKNSVAKAKWHELDNQFQAWKALENA